MGDDPAADSVSVQPAPGRRGRSVHRVEPDSGSRILFIFDSDALTTEQLAGITVDGQEIVGVRFVAAPALGDVTIPRLANRLSRAIEAKRENSIRYLESGVPIV